MSRICRTGKSAEWTVSRPPVDGRVGTVTISVRTKNMVVHTSDKTVIRRYAPDSVKFDDAKSSALQEIHPGDQIRARGDRSADGAELAAEEIVSGAFPLFCRDRHIRRCKFIHSQRSRSVVEKDSSRQGYAGLAASPLPAEMAQGIAMRLKGAGAERQLPPLQKQRPQPGSGSGQTPESKRQVPQLRGQRQKAECPKEPAWAGVPAALQICSRYSTTLQRFPGRSPQRRCGSDFLPQRARLDQEPRSTVQAASNRFCKPRPMPPRP